MQRSAAASQIARDARAWHWRTCIVHVPPAGAELRSFHSQTQKWMVSNPRTAESADAPASVAAPALFAGLIYYTVVAAVVAEPNPPVSVRLPCLTGWLPSCDNATVSFLDGNQSEMNVGWVLQPNGRVLLLVDRPIPLAAAPTGIWSSVLSSNGCSLNTTARGTDGSLECGWASACNDPRCLPSVLLAFVNGTTGWGNPAYSVSPFDGTLVVVSSAHPRAIGVVSARWDAGTSRFDWPVGTRSEWGNVLSPRIVWRGSDAGGIFNVLVTSSGLLATAFETDFFGRDARSRGNGLGSENVTVAIADNASGMFRLTNAVGTPTPARCLGAGEPTLTELANGSLLMMIRNEGGSLWQATLSASDLRLRPPARSRLMSSDTPSFLLRLRHNAWPTQPLLILWANAGTTWPLACNTAGANVPCVYTIRSVLHAALSFNDGESWHGHREVYRDPCARGSCFRNHRDYGVAYSTAVEQPDGTVLVKTGQGSGHWGSFVLDPRWVLEKSQSVDFSAPMARQHWNDARSFDGSFLSTCMLFDQICTSGPLPKPLPPNCSQPGADGVHLRKVRGPEQQSEFAVCLSSTEEGDEAAFVWNFPSGAVGTLNITLQTTETFVGARLALTDYYAPPYDVGAEQPLDYCTTRTNCSCGARCAPVLVLSLSPRQLNSRSVHVSISWNLLHEEAVYVATHLTPPVGKLRLLKSDHEGALSYLRVRGTGLCVREIASQVQEGANLHVHMAKEQL